MAKTFIGNIKGPKGDKGDKGDPGTGSGGFSGTHEDLTGLLGGNTNGHYHLTQEQLNKLENMPADGVSVDGSTIGEYLSEHAATDAEIDEVLNQVWD